MKKYRIELSEPQMRLIADCLEDISRFASGQWEMRHTVEEMLRGLPFDEQMKRRDEVEELLKKAKRVLLPNYPDNASKGYNGSDFIGNTYQIYRTILHQLAKDNNWDNVYSSPALPSGSLGTIKIEAIDFAGRSEQLVCDNHSPDLEHFMKYSESICKNCKQKV